MRGGVYALSPLAGLRMVTPALALARGRVALLAACAPLWDSGARAVPEVAGVKDRALVMIVAESQGGSHRARFLLLTAHSPAALCVDSAVERAAAVNGGPADALAVMVAGLPSVAEVPVVACLAHIRHFLAVLALLTDRKVATFAAVVGGRGLNAVPWWESYPAV